MDRHEEDAFRHAVENEAWRLTVRLREDRDGWRRTAWITMAALAALTLVQLAFAIVTFAAPYTLFVEGYRSVTGELVPLGGPTPTRTPTPVPTLSPTPQTPATPTPKPATCSGLSLDGRIGTREPPVYGLMNQRWAQDSETRYCLRQRAQQKWRRLTFTITRQCGDGIVPRLWVTEPNGREWSTTRVLRFQPSDAGTYSARVIGGAGFCFGSVEVEVES